MPPREISALLLASGLLSASIALDHGHYSPRALAVLLAGCAAAAVALHAYLGTAGDSMRASELSAPRPAVPSPAVTDRALATLLILLLVAGALDRPGFHIRHEAIVPAYAAQQWILATLVALSVPTLLRGGNLPRWLLPAGVCSALAFRIGIVLASPDPAIDVWWQFQQSAAHLLDGRNPYTATVTDPTGAAARYGYTVSAYAYPPGTLLVQTMAFALLGDVRFASVVADLATAAIIWRIARPIRDSTATLLSLLVLHQPRGLFVVEQSWQEPIIAAFLATAAWCALGGAWPRRFWAISGIALALKQYLVVFVASTLWGRPHRTRWMLVAAGATLAWLPFLVWDASATLQNGLWFQFSTPFRPDGLTLMSALHAATGAAPGKSASVLAGLAVSIALAWRTREAAPAGAWLLTGTLSLLAAFVFGSQAFANYYHLIAILLLLLVAVRLRESADPATTGRPADV